MDLDNDLSKHGRLKAAFSSYLPSSEVLPDMIRCLISCAHSYSGSASFASEVPQCLFEIWMMKEGDHCALHNAKREPVGCKYFSSCHRAEGRLAELEGIEFTSVALNSFPIRDELVERIFLSLGHSLAVKWTNTFSVADVKLSNDPAFLYFYLHTPIHVILSYV